MGLDDVEHPRRVVVLDEPDVEARLGLGRDDVACAGADGAADHAADVERRQQQSLGQRPRLVGAVGRAGRQFELVAKVALDLGQGVERRALRRRRAGTVSS